MTATNPDTLVENAIPSPVEPRHFMRIVPAPGRRTVTAAGHTIAQSERAVIVKEVGLCIYDPILCFPREDVDMDSLARISKTPHCPLKGDTQYLEFVAFDPKSVAHRTELCNE